MTARATLLAALLAFAGAARAAPFPTRQGEIGYLDVPTAEVPGPMQGLIGAQLRFDRASGTANEFGPLPLSLAIGLGERAELGFGMREWGYPGDARPSPLLMDVGVKYKLLPAEQLRPAIAADLYLDRLNWKAVWGLRLVGSTAQIGRVHVAGFLGLEGHGPSLTIGPTVGLAGTILLRNEWEVVAEALAGPRGPMLGAALQRNVSRNLGLTFGVDWLPGDHGFRLGFGFTVRTAPLERKLAPLPEAPREVVPVAPAAPQFADDRPRMRMRIRTVEIPSATDYRHLQHGPTALDAKPDAPQPSKAAAPTPADARRVQLQQREAQLDARERRLAAVASDLAGREQRLAARRAALDERERQLSAIQEQLLTRERQLGRTAPANDAERLLESQEARYRAIEGRLAAQERTLGATASVAARREQSSAAREGSLRAEAERLASAAAREKVAARQEEIRAKVLANRDRQLGAKEDRHVAWRERLDALEAEQQSRTDRLEARQARLADFRQRLDMVARRVAAQKGPAAARAPARKDAAGAVIVVVKPPTSILRSAPAAAAAAAGADQALHPGLAVEKAVAAATVVYFKTPEQTMGELDREAVENIAKLAAKERCELLVWARAQSPALMGEAARRAEELKQLAARAASVDPRQIVTRITVRPAATGVDVVVSALREQTAPAAAAAGEGAAGAGALREGETARRQVRDAIVKYQADIEGCVNTELARRPKLPRAEEVLKVSVDPQGRVVDLRATSTELAGGEMEKCLRAAAGAWRFPESDAPYEVEIPITVVGAGAKP